MNLTSFVSTKSLISTAMVLAAGRGERMRPLTDHTPKPLLMVQGKPLLLWHLQALEKTACQRVVMNTAWLGKQIENFIREQTHYFADDLSTKPLINKDSLLSISYSREGDDFGHALETAGGISRALPMLGDAFWLVAGDVFIPDFDFGLRSIEIQQAIARFVQSDALAHLWLIPNPEHHPKGDFGFDADSGLALNLPSSDLSERFTYSTIGLYKAALFEPPFCSIPKGNPKGITAPLAAILRLAMDQKKVSASLYKGRWTDVGTPKRLANLNV